MFSLCIPQIQKSDIKRAWHDSESDSAEELDSLEGQYTYDATTDGGEEYFSSENSVHSKQLLRAYDRHDYEVPTTTVDDLASYNYF